VLQSFHASPHCYKNYKFLNNPVIKTKLLLCYFELAEKYNLDTEAFCVMDDHFHILFGIEENKIAFAADSKFAQMKGNMFERYAKFCFGVILKSINRMLSKYYKGPFFLADNRKIRKVVDTTDKSFKLCYIHSNPVRAGICEKMHEYEHSSYLYYLNCFVKKNFDMSEYFLNLDIARLSLIDFYIERMTIAKHIRFSNIRKVYPNSSFSEFMTRHIYYESQIPPTFDESLRIYSSIDKRIILNSNAIFNLTRARVDPRMSFYIKTTQINSNETYRKSGKLIIEEILFCISAQFECFATANTAESDSLQFILFLKTNYPKAVNSLIHKLISIKWISYSDIAHVFKINKSTVLRIAKTA